MTLGGTTKTIQEEEGVKLTRDSTSLVDFQVFHGNWRELLRAGTAETKTVPPD